MPSKSAKKGAPERVWEHTTLTIDSELARLGKEYFKKTRYRSLSGFVDAMMKKQLRKDAAKIRAKGMDVPPSVFVKDDF